MRRRGYFDERAADTACRFFESLKLWKGKWAGVNVFLPPYMRHGVREIYGRKRADGTRQYRTAYLEWPRKNAKTHFGAENELKLLYADGEMGAEVYSAATTRDQASQLYRPAAAMVRANRELRRISKVVDSTKRIVNLRTASFLAAISAEAGAAHGEDSLGVVLDELHAWKGPLKREFYDALTTAGGAREQPLVFHITTAGFDKQSLWWELHQYADAIQRGTIEDDSWFVQIFAIEDGEDWQDEDVWRRVNPGIDAGIRSIDELRLDVRKALEMPSRQNTFRRLYLNDPNTQQSERWLDLGKWDAQSRTIDPSDYNGVRGWGFIDYGAVSDLTAWLQVFPCIHGPKGKKVQPGAYDPEAVDVVTRVWCPESRLEESTNMYREAYRQWAEDGWLMTTPGNATDYAFVRERIKDDCARFAIERLGQDRYLAGYESGMLLAEELGQERVVSCAQSFEFYKAPMDELERLYHLGKIHHGGHPVLRWAADNVVVRQDANGNLKPDKANSQGKIDPFTALVGAVAMRIRAAEPETAWGAV